MKAAVNRANELAADTNKYFMPDQFNNPFNPQIHFQTTGPEIWTDLQGKVDYFVAGVGTGGTITGVAQFLKNEKGLSTQMIAVEPLTSPVLTQALNGEAIKPAPHKIQGIGAGFVPSVLDLNLLDKVVTVSDEDAKQTALKLATVEGIRCGISSGAAFYAALQATVDAVDGSNIVVILPDSGERYLSSYLYEEVL
jgi:cysteine synthase A